jgi:predicted patatin/cPLA2 family phospholipase
VGPHELVDGGISDPLPVREAYRRGARTLVVVRSRAADFVKKDRLVNRFGAWTMRSKPPIARACRTTPAAYSNAVAFLRTPPADCRVIQVAPFTALATKRTSRDRDALERDYALGRALGREAIARYEELQGEGAAGYQFRLRTSTPLPARA